MKKFDFLCPTDLKLLGQIKGTAINNCEILKFVISSRGGQCDYLPQAPKHLAMPLYITGFVEEKSRVVTSRPGTWKRLKWMGLKFIQGNNS
jgi:hypothetical protein